MTSPFGNMMLVAQRGFLRPVIDEYGVINHTERFTQSHSLALKQAGHMSSRKLRPHELVDAGNEFLAHMQKTGQNSLTC